MTEETLIDTSPAMFRNHPVWFLILLLTLLFLCWQAIKVVVVERPEPEPIYLQAAAISPAETMNTIDYVLSTASEENLQFFEFLTLAGIVATVLVLWWISCKRTRLKVTSTRTILSRGIIFSTTMEVPHSAVDETSFRYSGYFQRIFDVGEILVRSIGKDGVDIRVPGLEDPREIIRVVDRHRRGEGASLKVPPSVIYDGFDPM